MAQLVLGQTTGAKGASNSKTYDPRSTYGIKATNQSRSSMAKQTVIQNNNTKAALRNTATPTGGSGGGGSSSGGSSSGGSSGGGGGGSSVSSAADYENKIIEQIKSLLTEQKSQADAYYKSLYEQQINKNKLDYEANRDQINVNRERGDRYIRNLYGVNPNSGQGITNRVRNNQNWINNLATAKQNYTNNDATALSSYNLNKANAANQLAQGWYNYVLPVYTNRQNYSDSLVNQQKLNEMELDYRKYLASLT